MRSIPSIFILSFFMTDLSYATMNYLTASFTSNDGTTIDAYSGDVNNTGDTFHLLNAYGPNTYNANKAWIVSNRLQSETSALIYYSKNYPTAYIELNTIPSVSEPLTYTVKMQANPFYSSSRISTGLNILSKNYGATPNGTSCTGWCVYIYVDSSYNGYIYLVGNTLNSFGNTTLGNDYQRAALGSIYTECYYGVKITTNGNSITVYADKNASPTTGRFTLNTTLFNSGTGISFYQGGSTTSTQNRTYIDDLIITQEKNINHTRPKKIKILKWM